VSRRKKTSMDNFSVTIRHEYTVHPATWIWEPMTLNEKG
jgi:hypothetical protein